MSHLSPIVLVHHDTNRYDLRVKTPHGTAVIHTTSTHLFWDPAAGRWAKAAALKYGTRLSTSGRSAATAVGGRTFLQGSPARTQMFDFAQMLAQKYGFDVHF